MPRSVSASIRSVSNPPKYSGCLGIAGVVEDVVDESLDEDDAALTSYLLVTKALQPIINVAA